MNLIGRIGLSMGCPIRRGWMAGRHPEAYKDVFTASQEVDTPWLALEGVAANKSQAKKER